MQASSSSFSINAISQRGKCRIIISDQILIFRRRCAGTNLTWPSVQGTFHIDHSLQPATTWGRASPGEMRSREQVLDGQGQVTMFEEKAYRKEKKKVGSERVTGHSVEGRISQQWPLFLRGKKIHKHMYTLCKFVVNFFENYKIKKG